MSKPLKLAEQDMEGGLLRQSTPSTPMAVLRQSSRKFNNDAEGLNLSMEWKDLTFTIRGKTILQDVSGLVEPGKLTAVLGPSGSGKTTLLNILAGRQRTSALGMELQGQITASGQRIDPVAFRTNIAYVMQEDTLLATETPRECLSFSAYLRLSRDITKEQRDEFVTGLLTTLHLEKCADTLVGSALIKGLSGGEKKRTSVGVELITNPKMLFLDEPLSGLDSYAAYTLVEALKALAEAGVPVLCTIHQPSSEIFAMFDDVVVLHAGKVAYHGPQKNIAIHFESLGHKCPRNYNPADFVLFLLQKESQEVIDQVKGAWPTSNLGKELMGKVTSAHPASAVVVEHLQQVTAAGRPGCCWQLIVLTAREARGVLRNKGIIGARLGMAIFLAGLYAWLFTGTASTGTDPNAKPNCLADGFNSGACTADFQAHFGSLVSLSIMAMMNSAQPILLQFPSERPVFLREYAAHQYGVVPYFISKTLVEMPVVLVSQLIIFCITYWIMGLEGSFVEMVATTWALGMASSSLALLVGCGVSSAQKAIQLAPLTLIPQMLFSGLFLPVSKIPISFRWVRWLCPLKYAIDLMTIIEFHSVKDNIDKCEQSHPPAFCQTQHPGDYLQQTLVESQTVEWDQWSFYLMMLAALLVGFRVLATILLWRKGRYVF